MVEQQVQNRQEGHERPEPLFIDWVTVFLECDIYTALPVKIKVHVIPAAAAGQVGVRPEVFDDGDQPTVRVLRKPRKFRGDEQRRRDSQ